MLSRVWYFVRETGVSLFRNISMTIAAILTIFVTLSLVGVSMLVFFWNAQGVKDIEGAVRFEVFLIPNADQAQIDSVREALEEDIENGNIDNIVFYSKDDAYNFFRREFQNQPDLVESATKEDLPVSFLAAPTNPDKDFLDDLIERYQVLPGVENIAKADFEEEILRARTINTTLALFASVLLVASCVLVFNTVRLAVYARRREIEIMKLVGASNWFVQVPFMAEGAFQGFLGGLGASVSAVLFKNLILDTQFSEGFKGFFVDESRLILTVFAVIFLGILVGLVSSFVGLKRYLDV